MSTSNREKYHFDDFTLNEYRKLIIAAKKNYVFRSYDTFSKDERFILWRHDVDFSVHTARNLALIEQEEGVKATYFLLPHCEFYNLFEAGITALVRDIIAMGHDIGLHFDSHYYNINSAAELERWLPVEQKWLENIFEVPVKSFSFHNTTDFTMSCQEWQYAGLINTYAAYFQKEVGYCSDSHGIWRFRRMKEVLEEASDTRLQALTHPAWWQKEIMSPRRRIQRCIEGRADHTAQFYDDSLARIGRPNIEA